MQKFSGIVREPYLVTRRWVYERFWEWGEKSLHWEARVRGEFPTQAEDALISLAWLGAAKARAATDGGGKVQAGIDVAEAGEAETVLAVREGSALLKMKAWSGIDARGVVAAELAPLSPPARDRQRGYDRRRRLFRTPSQGSRLSGSKYSRQ